MAAPRLFIASRPRTPPDRNTRRTRCRRGGRILCHGEWMRYACECECSRGWREWVGLGGGGRGSPHDVTRLDWRRRRLLTTLHVDHFIYVCHGGARDSFRVSIRLWSGWLASPRRRQSLVGGGSENAAPSNTNATRVRRARHKQARPVRARRAVCMCRVCRACALCRVVWGDVSVGGVGC